MTSDPDEADPGDTLGPAERLGPLLARGARADVHAWHGGEGPQDPRRVVKIYRGEHSRRSALATANALSAIEHPHLLRLAGVVELGAGRLGVVLPRLSTATAADWLASRRVISAGEAVTLLVPILLALLHVERRRIHPRLRVSAVTGLDDVLLDSRGAAVVTGVRVVEVGLPGRAEASPQEVARRLVGEVLASTVGGGSSARATLGGLCGNGSDIDELLEVLFELAEPVPLEGRLADDAGDTDPDDATAAASVEGIEGTGRLMPTGAPREMAPHVLDDLMPGLRVARETAAAALHSSPNLARLVTAVRAVRPRVWAMAGVLGVSAVVGIAVVGEPEPTTERPAEASSRASSIAETPGAPGRPDVPGRPSPRSSTAAILVGDDPDAAAAELLRLRAMCLAAVDRTCLEGVDEARSPILSQDSSAVDDPARLADLPIDLRIDAVVNHLGGAVLYRAHGPDDEQVSVLILRTGEGWRLRTIV